MTLFRQLLRVMLGLVLGSATLSALGIAPATGKHTIIYASAGPGRPDGYENAQVNVRYQFTDCPGGLSLGFRILPGTVRASPRYWHEGVQLNPPEAAPVVERVEFVADVMYRGSRIARLSFLDNHHVSTGSLVGCGALTMGRFPDFLPQSYTEADKIQMFRELEIWTAPTPRPLTNPAIGRRIAAERQAAAAQQAAAERAAKAERAAAERAQKEQASEELDRQEQADQARTAAQLPAGTSTAPGAKTAPYRAGSTPPGTPSRSQGGNNPAPTAAQREAAAALARVEQQRRMETRRAQRQVEQGAQNIANYLALESAGRSASRRIASLTRLSESIDSLDELEAEFERRRAEIDDEIERYAARQRAAASTVHRAFDDRAVGMATQNFVNAMQQYNTNNARNDAMEELEQERQRMHQQIQERRHQALLGGRQTLLEEFQDATLPRYADRIPGGIVYYFAYSLNPAEISQTHIAPTVFITNVFPVAQRGDGGWPLRPRLDAELAKVVPAGRPVTLAGYFLDAREATEMRDAFIRVASQSRLHLQELAFDNPLGKRVGAVANYWGDGGAAPAAADFWGDAPAGPAATEPDFWGDSAPAQAQPVKRAAPPVSDDFWR